MADASDNCHLEPRRALASWACRHALERVPAALSGGRLPGDRAREISYQIDRRDPADPVRKCLVVGLDAAIPAGPEDCSRPTMTLTISHGHSPFPYKAFVNKGLSGIELATAYISFSRVFNNSNEPRYGGAATTVQLDRTTSPRITGEQQSEGAPSNQSLT
jgi:hypothetical protein